MVQAPVVADTDTVREWGDWWRECAPAERARWVEWLNVHGIDPDWVVAKDARVERRVTERRIVYRTYARNETGCFALTPAGDALIVIDAVLQLESPPLPFPT